MSDHEEKRMKLFSACETGDKSLLVKLANSGVNPSDYDMTNDQGKSPLHIACRYGHIDIVRLLIEVYGCSPKVVDNTGSTPFHDVCYFDQVLIADYLIHSPEKPKEYLLSVDLNGNTPFHKANQAGSLRVIKYILHIIFTGKTPQKLGLDFDSEFYSQRATHLNIESLLYFKLKNKIGDAALAVACRHGQFTLLKMYMHYSICKLLNDIPDLVNISNQCGHFQIAHYLQMESTHGHVHDFWFDSQVREVLCYIDDDDYYVSGHHHQLRSLPFTCEKKDKHWNYITFCSQDPAIKSFCMAVLHDNEERIATFLALQEDAFNAADYFDICLAACVADNVNVLSHFFSDKVVSHSCCSLLHIACEWGSKHAVEYLITTRKCDINATNDVGETPLHFACRHERVEIVALLLKTGRCNTLNKLNLSKETPLHLACLNADPTIGNLILGNEQLSDLDVPDKFGDTPLMNACRSGGKCLIKQLLDKGCNPVYVNSLSKEMPVHLACRMQKLDVLQILLNKHGDKLDHRNILGETPLSIALSSYCIDVVTYLVEILLCDVSLTLCTYSPNSIPDFPQEYRIANLPQEEIESDTFQQRQMFGVGHYDRMNRRPSLTNYNVTSDLLHYPMYNYGQVRRKYVTVNTFVHQSHHKCLSGDTALHFACKRNDLKLVQLFLKQSPETATIPNSCGDTALHIAASNGSISVMKCLIASCKESLDNVLNDDGNSVLHLACKHGILKVVELLLDRCSVDLTNKLGNTPIHVACNRKSATLVSCLVEKCSGNLDHQRNKKNETYI